jgi:tetratricopeptide (TPR) repeat protein
MNTRAMFRIAAAALLVASPASTKRAAAQTTTDFPGIVSRLEAAVLADDASGIKEGRLACLRLLAASPAPDRVSMLRYTIAYADWRLGFAPSVPPKEQSDLLVDAQTQLEALTTADPRNAEALGLLASVYGAQIAHNPDLGMTLGPLSGQVLGRALALEANNPRLLLMQGETQFHTPPEYGGSIRQAEGTLRKALEQFDKEPATKAWPNWGRFDAHVWLGQALADRKDNAGARAEYERALKIAPNSMWVKSVLLPAVK